MEFHGFMYGHGKPIDRKGTKKSGFRSTVTCEKGDVEVVLNYNDKGNVVLNLAISAGAKRKVFIGTFDDFLHDDSSLDAIHTIEQVVE